MTVARVWTETPDQVWHGTAAELLVRVNACASPSLRARPGWPATGGALAAALECATRQLRLRGVAYQRSALGARPITLRARPAGPCPGAPLCGR